jgi:TolB-like protein/Tfp pilus assembly protein PilF
MRAGGFEPMALAAGTRFGPYEILAPIGAGGMGEVYRARDSRLERDVAVKVLPERLAQDPDALARFEREAKAVAALSHPNILAIHDFGTERGISYAVMELLEGEPLRHALDRSALAWRKAVEIGVAVAEGLAAAHAKGIVHRDLKPENIFLTSDGRVKILDFGLARVTPPIGQQEGQTTTLVDRKSGHAPTEPGAILGTVGYMSPEQVRGQPVDGRSDIFSLGCLLYEMVSGVRAFSRTSAAESLAAVLKEEPPQITASGRQFPPDLERVVTHCLEKRAEERFQTARDLAFALKALPSGSGPGASLAPAPAAPAPAPVNWLTRRKLALGGAAAAVLAVAGVLLYLWLGRASGIESIAVMPFVNVGGDPSAEYLSDGITEGIISQLSQLPNLGVMSRSSVFRYKGKDVDPTTVGRDLKAQAVLLGRVVRRPDGLTVSAELVDARNNRQIWGEQYSRGMADVQDVQETIAREISDRLRLRITGEKRQQIARRQTGNAEAYQLYLQGRFQWNKRTLDGMQQSIDLFQQAIAKDPQYALAHAGLADAYALLADYNVLPAREVMPRAKNAALRALQLDDTLAETHASLGWTKLTHDWAWPDAEREFQRAIQLNPNYATAHEWYGEYLILVGRGEEGLAAVQRAQTLEPASLVINRALGTALYHLGRYDQAADQARKTLSMDATFVGAHVLLGRALLQKGSQGEAAGELQKALDLSEGNTSELAALGYAYAASGRRADALKILGELKERASQTYVQPIWIAVIHAALGEKDEALAWLEKGYEDRSGWLIYLKVDPMFAPLRADPRFADLVRRVGLPG